MDDPICGDKLQAVINAITSQIKTPSLIKSTVQPRLLSPIVKISPGEKPKNLNSNKKYGEADEFVILLNHLPLADDEVIYDICPMRPGGLFSPFRDHRKNMIFTNKRFIQHSGLPFFCLFLVCVPISQFQYKI